MSSFIPSMTLVIVGLASISINVGDDMAGVDADMIGSCAIKRNPEQTVTEVRCDVLHYTGNPAAPERVLWGML